MKILHINTNYNVSTIYPNMVEAIHKNGDFSGIVYFPVENSSKMTTNNNSVVISNVLKKTDRIRYFYRNKKLLNNIENEVELDKVDMIIAYSTFSNGLLAETISQKYSKPYIVIVQNTDLNLYFKRMIHLRWVGRHILKNAYSVVFLSKPYQETTLSNYFDEEDTINIKNKSFIIPFGIDDFWCENMPQVTNDILDKHIKLLYVGKINKNKNITTTIKACMSLIDKGYKVTFTIVGDAENENILEKLKKYDFVKYSSFLDKSKLLEIYRQNHIFVMPSKRESFGLVYAEAISQGLPVIYTRNQGFDGHFQEGKVGYSVNYFDHEEIARRVIDIIEKYSVISENCLNSVSKFKWENIGSTYSNLIKINDENQ